MNFKKIRTDLIKIYDDLAEYWGKEIAKPDWGLDELNDFVTLVKKSGGKKILDLGCGSGIQSKQLLQAGLEVIGLDLSPEMIRQAKKRIPKAKFIVGDITKMDFPKESFDGVFAQASLLHIPKKLVPKVLGSIHKILRINGIFYLALKEGVGEKEVGEERLGRIIKRFFSFFTKEEIEDFLIDAKFKVLNVRRYTSKSSTIWLYVFVRKA
jgi:ubiquinone/menaquinone biosynthesis C-methylase UbiE